MDIKERKAKGRKVKKLRKEGVLPVNLYGKGIKSVSLQTSLKDFESVYKKEGETGLFEIKLKNKKIPVMIRNVQTDPVDDHIIHADLFKVNLKEKITATVPVVLVGEAPAEKEGLGTLVQQIDEVEVEALPNEIPDKFEISVDKLKTLDDLILIKDIESKKADITNDKEQIIAKVEEIKEEVIEEAPKEELVDEEQETDVETEGKKEEKDKEEAKEKTEESEEKTKIE